LTAKQTNKCYPWKVRRCLRSKTIMSFFHVY